MLKKALACATVAVAAAGVTGIAAPAAMANDGGSSSSTGGDNSQNLNVLPHLCVDAKRLNIVNLVPVDALTSTNGQQCNEDSNYLQKEAAPLSDLADLGANQS